MLRFFEDKAGVPFPHQRYTQLLVAGAEAQEASHFAIIGTQMIEPILSTPQEDCRTDIGEDKFWAGLKRFTQRHAGRTVTSTDFQAAMEWAAKRDLAPRSRHG
jgi:hypothetical protein